jgi:dihydroorotate dehydrogenase (NAD+) catalytic subunit
MNLDRLGGIVTKAVSREPRAGNRAPRVAEFPGGMLNSVGLANPGLARVLEEALPWLQQNLRKARVVVNVVGFTAEDFGVVVEGLEGVTGIAALEINLSCPNTSAGGLEFGADPASVTRVIALCRARTRLPLFANSRRRCRTSVEWRSWRGTQARMESPSSTRFPESWPILEVTRGSAMALAE